MDFAHKSIITIEKSEFQHNSAASFGGVLTSRYIIFNNFNILTIEESEFQHNSAFRGGVLYSYHCTIVVEESEFHNNNATIGGVLDSYSSNITIGGSMFTKNSSPTGAVIYAIGNSEVQHHDSYLLINNNWADRYAVIYLSESEFIRHGSENATFEFSSNLGSLVAFNSNATFMGYAIFVNNQSPQPITGDFQEGGAMTLFQSNVFFYGACNLE